MKHKLQARLISVTLICIMVFAFAMPTSWAIELVSVYLNDAKLDFDVPPQIINDRTMVPMRKIFESLGAVVSWDDATQTATGKKGDTIVNVTIDSKILFKNGTPMILDVPPVLIEGRTLVPVRAIAESFSCQVDWDEERQSVFITSQNGEAIEKPKLTALEISERVSPSVFYIEVYDDRGNAKGSGSGFFVSSEGVAVTNYHVIEETAGAKITTIYGEKHQVSEIIAYDPDLDIAIIRVDKNGESGKTVSGFQPVTIANSDLVKAGQVVYALGSPVGLQNTISDGIISNAKQVVGKDVFIQITAPISHGSSGGALVDEYGEVIGITSAGIDEAQNIGFAIPINNIMLFDMNAEGVPYSEFAGSDAEFILAAYPEIVELNVGESTEILVYAQGKGEDWSIYWNTEDTDLVSCKWGSWLEKDNNICSLTIMAKNPGTATITIYSDVDFRGVDVTVRIHGSQIETYPSSRTKIPTYTAITGVQPLGRRELESSTVYVYQYYSVNTVQSYVDYLLDHGFAYYDEAEEDGYILYQYITPEGRSMAIALVYKTNQAWIFVPR